MIVVQRIPVKIGKLGMNNLFSLLFYVFLLTSKEGMNNLQKKVHGCSNIPLNMQKGNEHSMQKRSGAFFLRFFCKIFFQNFWFQDTSMTSWGSTGGVTVARRMLQCISNTKKFYKPVLCRAYLHEFFQKQSQCKKIFFKLLFGGSRRFFSKFLRIKGEGVQLQLHPW